MAKKLKEMYLTRSSIKAFADVLGGVARGFDRVKFTRLVLDEGFKNKELMARMRHTTECLHEVLPKPYKKALAVLRKAAPKAKGMDLGELKKEFGRHLSFHGSMDIQETLPLGTVEDVKNEVKQRMEVGKPGGGFIICTAHNIQVDNPIQNIVALVEAYHEYGWY